MKNFIKVLLIIGLMWVIYGILSYVIDNQDKPKIAITQIVQHPSLDDINQGIMDALRDNGLIADQDYTLLYENAQGNMGIATQIAQKFAAEQPDVIVAISTPSAQTVYQTVRPLNIPVVFSAVTDPVEAKLIHSLDQNGGNITGTIDAPSSTALLQQIIKLIPNLHIMAIIYSPSEINSCKQIENMKIAAKQHNISIIEIAASQTTDVSAAAQKAVSQASAIYIPNDNMIISALDSILQIADAVKIPVFTNNAESVKLGSLAAVANNQYDIGYQTGKMVLDVLNKHDASKIPVKVINADKLYINKHKAKLFNISIDTAYDNLR